MDEATDKILVYPDPVLRTRADEITNIHQRVIDLADRMASIMYAAPGIGLAAPQVGVSERLIVLDVTHPKGERNLITLINPSLAEQETTVHEEEGCLSLPGISEPVVRAGRVLVRGINLDGNEREIEADGILAVALQHEIDHLDGILFIDRLSSLKKGMIQRKIRKMIRDGAWNQ
jgi:peptide deformylase